MDDRGGDRLDQRCQMHGLVALGQCVQCGVPVCAACGVKHADGARMCKGCLAPSLSREGGVVVGPRWALALALLLGGGLLLVLTTGRDFFPGNQASSVSAEGNDALENPHAGASSDGTTWRAVGESRDRSAARVAQHSDAERCAGLSDPTEIIRCLSGLSGGSSVPTVPKSAAAKAPPGAVTTQTVSDASAAAAAGACEDIEILGARDPCFAARARTEGPAACAHVSALVRGQCMTAAFRGKYGEKFFASSTAERRRVAEHAAGLCSEERGAHMMCIFNLVQSSREATLCEDLPDVRHCVSSIHPLPQCDKMPRGLARDHCVLLALGDGTGAFSPSRLSWRAVESDREDVPEATQPGMRPRPADQRAARRAEKRIASRLKWCTMVMTPELHQRCRELVRREGGPRGTREWSGFSNPRVP